VQHLINLLNFENSREFAEL